MLLVMRKGPLRKAIRGAATARGRDCQLASPLADDLFERALGREALVYAPARSLLSGWLQPAPDPDRMRRVVGAAAAPGCSLVVCILPAGTGHDAEVEVLRRSGKPYIIVSAPPLLEEVGLELARTGSAVWIPRGGRVRVASAEAVARAALDATESEWQGRVERVEGDVLDLPEAFERAARTTRRDIRVHAVWPPLHRVALPVARWLSGGREPPASKLAGALLESPPPPAR